MDGDELIDMHGIARLAGKSLSGAKALAYDYPAFPTAISQVKAGKRNKYLYKKSQVERFLVNKGPRRKKGETKPRTKPRTKPKAIAQAAKLDLAMAQAFIRRPL